MINVKRELRLQPLAMAALLFGAFTLSTALAADRQGLSWQELQTLTGNSFEANLEGNQIRLAGMVPESCLEDASASYSHQDGNHVLVLHFPKCPDGRSAKPGEPAKALSEAKIQGSPIVINVTKSGKLFLGRMNAGDPNSKRRAQLDPLLNTDNNQIQFESAEAKADRERKSAEAMAAEQQLAQANEMNLQQKAQWDNLLKRSADLCRSGDFVGLGMEIESIRPLLGDVTDLLNSVTLARVQKLEKDLKRAKDVEELRIAYDALIAVLLETGKDEEEVYKKYADRRFELAKESVEAVASNEKTPSEVDSEIRELISELRGIDQFRKRKPEIAWLYTQMATHLRNASDLEAAELYYTKGMEFAGNDDRLKVAGEMAKMYIEAWKACVDKYKTQPGKCERIADKAKKHAEGAEKIAALKKGEDDLNALKIERIQMFGMDGYSMNVSGYGKMSLYPQAAGEMEKYKRMKFQEGQQELQMQQLMRSGAINPAQLLQSQLGVQQPFGLPGAGPGLPGAQQLLPQAGFPQAGLLQQPGLYR